MWAGLIGFAALAAWIYLLGFRGMFWRFRERDEGEVAFSRAVWPSIAAIVPARDEAAVIAYSVGSLLPQDYPGDFRVLVVDDQSSDGMAQCARALAGGKPLEVLRGAEPLAGWTGKLWALKQGVSAGYYNSDLPFSALYGARGLSWTKPIAQYYQQCADGTLPNTSAAFW